ncbi:unnamed protein product [Heterobilharzia americana]|nr:unnamed protein product [Heterobilharzia americana]
MSNSLNTIMLILRNSIDSTQNITDVNAVCDIIERLENFPMTMNQLQDTRIGQLLQTIRHKAWQKLLSSDYSHQCVIPIKTSEKVASGAPRPNGTPTKPLVREKSGHCMDAVNTVCPPQLKCHISVYGDESSVRPTKRNLPDSSPSKMCKDGASKTHAHQIQQSENFNSNLSKRLKCIDSPSLTMNISTVGKVSSPNNLLNGSKCSELMFKAKSDISISQSCITTASRSPIQQSLSKPRVNNSTRLSKVKSTAELVQAAESVKKSTRLEYALWCNLQKHVLNRTTSGPHSTSRTSSVNNNNEATHLPKSCTLADVKPEVHSEYVEKSASYEKSSISVSDFHQSPAPAQTLTSVSSNQSPVYSNNNEDVPGQVTLQNINKDAQKVKKKKKHKRHKYHLNVLENPLGSHSTQLECQQGDKKFLPPVTNFMDDWPELPSLPDNIDWHSLDRSCVAVCDNTILCNEDSDYQLEKYIEGTELEYTCISPTNLHSVSLGDQYLHILPWVDMVGYKRQFFPPCSDQDLSELITMPEPW